MKFLRLTTSNLLLTVAVMFLPLIRERVLLPSGGFEVEYYRPMFLLSFYLQTSDYYPFVLMLGFLIFVYLVVCVVMEIGSKIVKRINR